MSLFDLRRKPTCGEPVILKPYFKFFLLALCLLVVIFLLHPNLCWSISSTLVGEDMWGYNTN